MPETARVNANGEVTMIDAPLHYRSWPTHALRVLIAAREMRRGNKAWSRKVGY